MVRVQIMVGLVCNMRRLLVTDVDLQSVPPRVLPTPQSLAVQDGVYDLRFVPLTSISMVTSRMIKVDVDGIVEKHSKTRMTDAILALDTIVKEWISTGAVPEVDWRIRSFDFQQMLREKDRLLRRVENPACLLCADFDHHVRVLVLVPPLNEAA